ncbi:hypothetical protein Tcan_07750 [Toxocara canis]|uniref:Uncharacterized protein n=1 Tax=Toxocara canis TaxID=6265 RepID=A0A0B2UPJ3_TOXCA|nr:hypothetical protein Tcan_07750 [Toxocara canis]
MTDGDLFDQRQTTIPAVTTINTTTMADHDKLLTFEQSHTDVGPELNLVEDVVEQRRTLSKSSPSAPPPPSKREAFEEKRTSPKRKCRGVRSFLKGKGREGSRDDKLSPDSPYKGMKSSNITDGAFY